VTQERPRSAQPLDANRPFLFAIRDIPTNSVLFVGRVLDPK
jgi:serine protease inhibitor